MAFDAFWGYVRENPAEALQAAAIIGSSTFGAIVLAGTSAWWLSNSWTKSKLDVLDERIKLANDRERDLIKKLEALQADIAKLPQTPELDKKSEELDLLKGELSAATKGVSQAFGVVEETVGGVWNSLKKFVE